MLINALMAVLHCVLEPTLTAESFVDYLTILHSSEKVLQSGMDAIDAFMEATGQVVNLQKTKTFGPQGGAEILFKGTPVPKTDAVKILGTTWQFRNQNLDLQVNPGKVRTAIALAHRIRYAGLPFHLRNALIGSLVMSKIFYGIEILDLSLADERQLRTAIGFCIWQKSSKQRSPGLLLTLNCKGHVVDPTQLRSTQSVLLTNFNKFRSRISPQSGVPDLLGLISVALKNDTFDIGRCLSKDTSPGPGTTGGHASSFSTLNRRSPLQFPAHAGHRSAQKKITRSRAASLTRWLAAC